MTTTSDTLIPSDGPVEYTGAYLWQVCHLEPGTVAHMQAMGIINSTVQCIGSVEVSPDGTCLVHVDG